MDIGIVNTQCLQSGNNALHHGLGSADVKLVAPKLEGIEKQRDIDPAPVVIIDIQGFRLIRPAIAEMEMEAFMGERQGLQLVFHDRFATVAHTVTLPRSNRRG